MMYHHLAFPHYPAVHRIARGGRPGSCPPLGSETHAEARCGSHATGPRPAEEPLGAETAGDSGLLDEVRDDGQELSLDVLLGASESIQPGYAELGNMRSWVKIQSVTSHFR